MARPVPRTAADAVELARGAFGLRVNLTSATQLPSYDDQNWLLHVNGTARYVLKVAAAGAECRGFADDGATLAQLRLENAAMRALHARGVSVALPLRASTGEDVVRVPAPAAAGGAACAPASADARGARCSPPGSTPSTPSRRHAEPPPTEFVRLLTFERGELLARVQHSRPLLRALGVAVAQTSLALRTGLSAADEATAATRHLSWDLANAPATRRHLQAVSEPSDRALAARFLDGFVRCAREREALGAQVIHGDLNDYNILVQPQALAGGAPGAEGGGANGAHDAGGAAGGSGSGGGCGGCGVPCSAGVTLLDFGDIVRARAQSTARAACARAPRPRAPVPASAPRPSPRPHAQAHSARLHDLAVCLAYVCQNKPDGRAALQAACEVVRGYSAWAAAQARAAEAEGASAAGVTSAAARELPLSRLELQLLHTCVCARLAQSVLMSAHAVQEEPHNAEYLLVNAQPGWRLMRQWQSLTPAAAAAAYIGAATEGAGGRRPRAGQPLRWAPRTRRGRQRLAGALAGLAAVLAFGVGWAAVRAVRRRAAG